MSLVATINTLLAGCRNGVQCLSLQEQQQFVLCSSRYFAVSHTKLAVPCKSLLPIITINQPYPVARLLRGIVHKHGR